MCAIKMPQIIWTWDIIHPSIDSPQYISPAEGCDELISAITRLRSSTEMLEKLEDTSYPAKPIFLYTVGWLTFKVLATVC